MQELKADFYFPSGNAIAITRITPPNISHISFCQSFHSVRLNCIIRPNLNTQPYIPVEYTVWVHLQQTDIRIKPVTCTPVCPC